MRLILININAFKNKLFPFYSGNYYEELEEESSEKMKMKNHQKVKIKCLTLALLNKLPT